MLKNLISSLNAQAMRNYEYNLVTIQNFSHYKNSYHSNKYINIYFYFSIFKYIMYCYNVYTEYVDVYIIYTALVI